MKYKIIRSNRKTTELQVNEKAEVVVRAPKFASDNDIKRIVEKNKGWIESHIQAQKERQASRKSLSEEEIATLKQKAKIILPVLTELYAERMGVSYSGVKITSAQKRFGSCSGKTA